MSAQSLLSPREVAGGESTWVECVLSRPPPRPRLDVVLQQGHQALDLVHVQPAGEDQHQALQDEQNARMTPRMT